MRRAARAEADATPAVTVTLPEDRRFRRAKVRPSGRRRRAGRWLVAARWVVSVAAVAAGVGWGGRALLAMPQLRVQRIVVNGNHRLSNGEVMALLDGLRGQSVIRADLEEWRRRLLDSPWVDEAGLRRVLPATVEVAIVERQPLGIGRFGGRLYLLDASGAVIDEYGPQYTDFDLPIIDGLAVRPGAREAGVDSRAALAGRLLAALAPRRDLLGQVSQVDVGDPRDAVLILENDSARLHLGEHEFVERLQGYMELAPALRSRVPEIDTVDMRFDSRVIVRPARDGVPGASRDGRKGGPATR